MGGRSLLVPFVLVLYCWSCCLVCYIMIYEYCADGLWSCKYM